MQHKETCEGSSHQVKSYKSLFPLCVFMQVQQKEESDEVIAKSVSVKLADAAGISYSEIATKAYESGRTELAIKVRAPTEHVLIRTKGHRIIIN